MKNMRRIASFLLALVMVLSLTTTAFAAEGEEETFTVQLTGTTTEPTTGHTYAVYQIFTGTLNGSTLSDIMYGSNYTPGTATTTTLVPSKELEAITDARAFAQDLMTDNSDNTVEPAVVDTVNVEGEAYDTLNSENGFKLENVPAGYYLIVDTTQNVPQNDSKSAYIVEVVQNVDIAPKSETTSSGKKIRTDDYLANNDTNISAGTYDNVAIGTKVTFELNAKVPSNAVDYDNYFLVLNDTLSTGLTFDASSVNVYLSTDDTYDENDTLLTKDTNYKLFDNTNDGTTDDADNDALTFQVSILNANHKDNPDVDTDNTMVEMYGKYIVVVYDATVNENVKILPTGNPNEFYPIFSNDPEYEYDGDDTDGDGRPDEESDSPVGEGPHDKTWTYTTGLKILKVDDQDNALKGAEFQLTGDTTNITLVSTETFVIDNENGTYRKLKNGAYTEDEIRTADQMVQKGEDDDLTKGYVKTDDETRADYVVVDGQGYASILDSEVGSVTEVYTLVKANSQYFDTTDTNKYKKTVLLTQQTDGETTDIKAYVGDDGYLYFLGLGAGEYTLTETKTPDGYNSIDPIKVNITWTAPTTPATDSNCKWEATADGKAISAGTETLVAADGTSKQVHVFELEIENVPGSNLPETGGMGTTLFYVFGGIMVLAAVVLLVTKKRMGEAQ